MGDLTANFSKHEFESRGAPVWNVRKLRRLAANLEVIRAQFGLPIDVISGCRSLEHNTDVDGAPDSEHLRCDAADISIEGISTPRLEATIEALIKAGRIDQGGMGLYKGWVHYDIRGDRQRWESDAMKGRRESPDDVTLVATPTVDEFERGATPGLSVTSKRQSVPPKWFIVGGVIVAAAVAALVWRTWR